METGETPEENIKTPKYAHDMPQWFAENLKKTFAKTKMIQSYSIVKFSRAIFE